MNRYKVTLKHEFWVYANNEYEAKKQFSDSKINPSIEILLLREIKGNVEI